MTDDELRIKIDLELRSVNDQMSTYIDASEISRFNQSASTEWFAVSPDTAAVVEYALEVSRRTGGGFDVTVGPLVNAWSFGTGERSKTVPDDAEIERLRGLIGYQKLEVRAEPPAIRKSAPGLQVDLSSIAKGHGVDRIVELLAGLGASDVFVEVGGEVRTNGVKPDGSPWRVGIQMPDARSEVIMIAHEMTAGSPAGTSMATSGDYRNFFVVDGKRYSHTIDPRSGRPVEHAMASVTVVAKTCMQADAWATALNVLGPDVAKATAEENGLHTLSVSRKDDLEGNASYQRIGTGSLRQYALAEAEKADSEAATPMASLIPVTLLSFGVFGVLISAMAIGVIFGRKSISGSCGGIANVTGENGESSCALCSNPSDACRELKAKMEQKDAESQVS